MKKFSAETTFKSLIRPVLVFTAVSYYVACSPVKFETNNNTGPGVDCVANNTCAQSFHHHHEMVVQKQPIDILFVVDNSGSTSDIQQNIAQRFGSLLSRLGQLDYRIGITTTDISSNVSDTRDNPPRAINGNGTLQDGKLVPLTGAAGYYITPQTANPAGVFGATIQRQETLTCMNSGYQADNCASTDPRGVFATNLVVSNNPSGFLRDNVPLTVVIVSDSDERNSLEFADFFPLLPPDQPATLKANWASRFPTKSLVVNAIVVRPGDSACYNARYHRNGNPWLQGFYATTYADLVGQTGGVLGSVCAADYTSQLGQIGEGANVQAQSLKMACRPQNDSYTVRYNGQAPDAGLAPSVNWQTLTMTFPVSLTAGTLITLDYNCAH